MAMLINSDCINCNMCEPECPNGAIYPADEQYLIDAAKCTECVGHFDKSQCVAVCPVDCIVHDPGHVETREVLQEKYQRLTASVA